MSTQDVLNDLGVPDRKIDAELVRSHSSVSEELLEQIKEQLREELASSMKETRENLVTLKQSIQQSRISDSVGYTSNQEVAKLRAELVSLRKELNEGKEQEERDCQQTSAFEAKNELSSMKAEFIKAMARKALSRDVSKGLTSEMNTVFEDDDESIDDDSVCSESSHMDMYENRLQLDVEEIKNDQSRMKPSNAEGNNGDTGGIGKLETAGLPDLTKALILNHAVTRPAKVVDESVVIEPQQPFEQDLFDENDKRGAFPRLSQMFAARRLKKSQTKMYISLHEELEATVSKRSRPRRQRNTEMEICILSPRRVPSTMPTRDQIKAITHMNPDGDMVQSQPMSYKAQAKTIGNGDGTSCVLLCLSPTAPSTNKAAGSYANSAAAECPVAVSSSMSSFGSSEDEIERYASDEKTISFKPLLKERTSDGYFKLTKKKFNNSAKSDHKKRMVVTEEAIEVARTASSSSTSMDRVDKVIFSDTSLSAIVTATGEIEAYKQ
mmetsp:Transcript_10823/g.29939  ORF Transcript_10823/g.29939 Transcript_10823/m.29939 type:complete len:495 (-) Transcript_10823:157-1641(-)